MTKIITIIFLLLCFSYGNAQNFVTFIHKSDSSLKKGSVEQAASYYEMAIKSLKETYLETDELYWCSQLFALSKNKSKSIYYLEKAIRKGGLTAKVIQREKDLDFIKGTNQWDKIMKLIKEKDSQLDTSLIKTLKTMNFTDQFYRAKFDSLNRTNTKNDSLVRTYRIGQRKFDSINVVNAKTILDKRGFPPRLEVGNDNQALFFVIQHSSFGDMEYYYPLFEKAADNGDLSWRVLCLMTDRIRKKKGLKQIYGTQIVTDKGGVSKLYDVEDFPNLNERRLKIGLGTIEDYLKNWGIKI